MTTRAVEHLYVDRLSPFIKPWNIASIKTAARAGYEFEGFSETGEPAGGGSHDLGSYVRTRSDQPA